ncbi:MAG: TIGR03663 family protein [Verrucomicrobiales bacterium]|nr:TIGR03663 family protein [Verrucomicrobiales bacterium]
MNRWLALSLMLAAFVALALRWPGLDRRPMHADEAVNARIFQGLWERGEYRYNPDEYHGPTLHYASLPLAGLSGAKDFSQLSERNLRSVAVLAGLALVILVALLRDGLGNVGTAAAALLLAISPAMVFYSRYFIHEMLLVAFTLLLIGGAWRYLQSPCAAWAVVAGAGLGLTHATKETFIIHLVAMGGSLMLMRGWQRWRVRESTPSKRTWQRSHLALALGVAAGISSILFTSFFQNGHGLVDSVATYLPWMRRAGGHSPHIHGWSFYFERLFWYRSAKGPLWSEAFIAVLALVGGVAAWTRKDPTQPDAMLPRFLVCYAAATTGAYTIIPYKTPWCLLNFLLPTILLAGVGAEAIVGALGRLRSAASSRAVSWAAQRLGLTVATLVMAGAAVHLAWQAWRASHSWVTHRGNPYTYAQTLPNLLELTDRVRAITAVSPQGADTTVKVIVPNSDYWPLPWYLRSLRGVWWLDALPADPYAPIIIVAANLKAALDDSSQRRYLSVGYYELRPREFLELYVEFELWKRFVATLPRPSDDDVDSSPLSP